MCIRDRYELSTKFSEDIRRDLDRLQKAIQAQDADNEIRISDDQDGSSEPEQDDSEPLVATSLHDVVAAQESASSSISDILDDDTNTDTSTDDTEKGDLFDE